MKFLAKNILKQSRNAKFKCVSQHFSTVVKNKPEKCPAAKLDLQEEWNRAKPFYTVPGPTRLQMLRGFMKGGDFYNKNFDKVMLMCRERFGDIYLMPGMFGQNTNLITFNPEDFEKIFRTVGPYPERPGSEVITDYRKGRKDDLYKGNLGATGSGPEWVKFRNTVNPVLMHPKNVAHYMDPTVELMQEFIARIRRIRDPASQEVPADFITDIIALSFESVALVALDKTLGFLRHDVVNAESRAIFENLKCFNRAFYDLGVKPSLYKYIKTPTYRNFEKSMDTLTNLCAKYVNETMKELKKKDGDITQGRSVLQQLFKIDPKTAVIMSVDTLFAGVDSETAALSGILLSMACNPDKQEKLRKEVLSRIGKTEKFTTENMKNMPYLRACIKESMRIYPILFGNMRATGADVSLSGYQIPKGTSVFLASHMLLLEDKYCPRAKEYIPERWLRSPGADSDRPDTESLMPSNPFLFFPFGFGARSCIGKRVVSLQMEIILASLVRNFKVEYRYPTENAFKNYFTNFCVIPLKFKFIDL
uniref:Cytochrome P450 n=1 Tax=Stomoxys calcitrans TaxID=35570 RepID=A0A1I8PM56_STOCA